MALVNCPECSNSISEYAKICTNCGKPIFSRINHIKSKVFAFLRKTYKLMIAILLISGLVGTVIHINERNLQVKQETAELARQAEKAEQDYERWLNHNPFQLNVRSYKVKSYPFYKGNGTPFEIINGPVELWEDSYLIFHTNNYVEHVIGGESFFDEYWIERVDDDVFNVQIGETEAELLSSKEDYLQGVLKGNYLYLEWRSNYADTYGGNVMVSVFEINRK